jgi:hypothetical protein
MQGAIKTKKRRLMKSMFKRLFLPGLVFQSIGIAAVYGGSLESSKAIKG